MANVVGVNERRRGKELASECAIDDADITSEGGQEQEPEPEQGEEDHHFSLTDYTLVSEWEHFTAALEMALSSGKEGEQVIPYHGGTLVLTKVNPLTELIPVLRGVPHFSLPPTELGRIFGEGLADDGPYWILRGGRDVVLTPATARLLLSSGLLIGASHALLVEYGEEGQIMGIGRGGRHLYSLGTFQGGSGNCSPAAQVRSLVLEHMPVIRDRRGRTSLLVSYAATAMHRFRTADARVQLRLRGLPVGCPHHALDSYEVTLIYPRIEPGLLVAALLPAPTEAPIWTLTLNRHLPREVGVGTGPGDEVKETHLVRLVRLLGQLLQRARTSMCDVRDRIHDKVRLFHLLKTTGDAGKSSSADVEADAGADTTASDDGGRREQRWEGPGKGSIDANKLASILTDPELPFHGRITLMVLLALTAGGEVATRLEGRLWDGSFSVAWSQVIVACRGYWARLEYIPGCPLRPDLERMTLLEQKLSMLNYCIHRERELFQIPGYGETMEAGREQQCQSHQQQSQPRKHQSVPPPKDDDQVAGLPSPPAGLLAGGEDEFFDALETAEGVMSRLDITPLNKLSSTGGTGGEREGAREEHAHLRLVKDGRTPIWVPYTQEACGPLTMDMVMGDRTVSEREDRKYAHLISDMQAFKAANPQASFVDFIRWHSPRDYSTATDGSTDPDPDPDNGEGEGEKGLSSRMRAPGNLWRSLWAAAAPLPLTRQRLLFDPRREAERALFWLEDAGLGEFLCSLLPLTMDLIAELGEGRFPPPPPEINEDSLATYLTALGTAEELLSIQQLMAPLNIIHCADETILVADDLSRETLKSLLALDTNAGWEHEVAISSVSATTGAVSDHISSSPSSSSSLARGMNDVPSLYIKVNEASQQVDIGLTLLFRSP